MSVPWTLTDLTRLRSLMAEKKTAAEIGKEMARTRKAIIAAAERYAVGSWDHGQTSPKRLEIPADFAECWATMSQVDLAQHYGHCIATINNWVKHLGLKRVRAKAPPKPVSSMTWAANRSHERVTTQRHLRDTSKVGEAVDYLRRYGPVWRCNDRGGASIGGKFWRRGSAILTNAEVIERAERLGFDADAWKRVAA